MRVLIHIEDNTVEFISKDGINYDMSIMGLSGMAERASISLPVTAEEMIAIVSLAMHPEGMPDNVDECYKKVEYLFKDIPKNLRIIP